MENISNIILLYPNNVIKKNNQIIIHKKRINKTKKLSFLFLLLSIVIFLTILVFFFIFYARNKVRKNKSNKSYLNLDLKNIHNILNFSLQYDEFNENINEKYILLQNYFCKEKENINQELENKIEITNVKFKGQTFNMFVYKGKDYVSYSIKNHHNYEGSHTITILKALDFYKKKYNLENKDIYILDVGSNIGWYTYFLGKYGFKIMSFEANRANSYILYKNYCLNKDVKATIINKGLDLEEKKCYLKIVEKNQGDGITYCDNLVKLNQTFDGQILNNIELTTLSKYLKFLTKNNLALIKIDVEGAEGNVIMGGIKLISEYHIPFIFMEYSKKYLEAHGTNVLEFLQLFEKHGYKISMNDFFSKNYISSFKLLKKNHIINLFITHKTFLETIKTI